MKDQKVTSINKVRMELAQRRRQAQAKAQREVDEFMEEYDAEPCDKVGMIQAVIFISLFGAALFSFLWGNM